MKPVDKQMERLMQAAAAVPEREIGEAPFALEARTLAAWRGATGRDEGEFMVVWFRRAALCGCILALASVAWGFEGRADQAGAELTIANSAMGMGVDQ
jgi:hypothetical protein